MSIVASRYAKAVFELAQDQNQLEVVDSQLASLAELWLKSASLRDVFRNPSFDAEQRRSIIGELVSRVSAIGMIRNLLRVLSDRGRMDILPDLATKYRHLAEARLGRVRAEVVTAVELPEAYFEQLQQRLEQVTGKTVLLERRVDSTLLAGVVTRVGDYVLDGSVRSHLSRLREELLQSQSI